MERLHKFMAHCGIASRRQAEEYIRQERVKVNGETISELGVKVDPENDVVEVDGKVLKPEKKVCYLLHKPRGYATTVDDDLGRRTVLDLMSGVSERIYPAGRLDLDSEGLIVLTNDGDAAYFLTHPSCGVRKVYEALVEGNVENETIETLLEKGVYLGAMRIKPVMAKIVKRQSDSTVVRIIVSEGVNREVRRLFAALGHEVKRLVRLEVGPFKIDGIGRGKYRMATPQEIAQLYENMRNAPEKKTGEENRPAKKKFGAPSPRPGKPDPALYGNGEKPRRAPLVLKKKNKPSAADDNNSAREDYGDSSFFDGAGRPGGGRGNFGRGGNGRDFRDVSYETPRNGRRTDYSRDDGGYGARKPRGFGKPDYSDRPGGKNRQRRDGAGYFDEDLSDNRRGRKNVKRENGGFRQDDRPQSRRFGDENFSRDFRRPPSRGFGADSRDGSRPGGFSRGDNRSGNSGNRRGEKFTGRENPGKFGKGRPARNGKENRPSAPGRKDSRLNHGQKAAGGKKPFRPSRHPLDK